MAMSRVGPVGGQGGGPFDDVIDHFGGPEKADLNDVKITSLYVYAGDTIDRLVVVYYPAGDPRAIQVTHGASNGGAALPGFHIGDGEYLTTVTGWTREFDGTLEVCGFRFWTSSGNSSGRLGRDDGTAFSYQQDDGEIAALWGRKGLFLDALGVWIRTPPRI